MTGPFKGASTWQEPKQAPPKQAPQKLWPTEKAPVGELEKTVELNWIVSSFFRACALLSITGASSGEGARTRSCAGLHAATSTAPRATTRHRPAEGTASKREQIGSKGSVDTAPGTTGTCPTATKAKAKRAKPAGASDSCRSDSFTSPRQSKVEPESTS